MSRIRSSVNVAVETLEGRRLLSTATLRIVNYNIEADINGDTAPLPGMATVLEGIGAYSIGGTAKPIDILALEETTSNSATVNPIVTSLNSFYGAGTYADSTLQGTEVDGDPTTGNGPSALIYNTKTVILLNSVGVAGTLGSSTGVYRQILRYEFQAVGGTAASDFYLYVDHYKSGSSSTDATDRAGEAAVVRNDEATLPATARVIYSGDFNTSTDGEAMFTTLMGTGQGQAFDALDQTGGVGDVSSALTTLTESAVGLTYRDDYQMVTQNVLDDSTGLELVPNTEQAFGNNGSVPAGSSVDSSSNTALAGLSNRSAVLSALTTASDHLPVVADYTVPLTTTTAPIALTGSVIGTSGSYQSKGNTAANAFDGNLSTFFDAPTASTAWAGLDLGAADVVTQIKFAPRSGWAARMVGGEFQASSSATFSSNVITLYTVPSTPVVGSLTTVNLNNTAADRYVRYIGPTGSYCNIAEAQLFGTTTLAQRTGTTLGTAGSYQNDGNTIAMATDGNLSTFFDAPTANGNWVGLDLGSAESIVEIRYAPRSGWAARMVGGEFQTSTSANFSSGVTTIYTITTTPPVGVLTNVTLSSPVTARYVRYLSPNGSYGNISEFQLFG